jgi:hypothetical protein
MPGQKTMAWIEIQKNRTGRSEQFPVPGQFREASDAAQSAIQYGMDILDGKVRAINPNRI